MAEKKYFPLFAILVIIGIIASIFLIFTVEKAIFHVSIHDDDKDIRNWVSLTIESGIGIFIAMMVLYYDKLQQKKNEEQEKIIENLTVDIKKIVERQQEIIEEQAKFTTKKRDQSYTGLNGNIFALRFSVRNLEREFDLFQKKISSEEEYKKQIAEYLPHVKNSLENLQNYCDTREQYLDETILNDINKLLIEGNLYCVMGQQSREFFDPTRDYPELIHQIWDKIPDPHDGYKKLKNSYGWNVSRTTS